MNSINVNTQIIIRITGIDQVDINSMIFESGIEYLRREAEYDEWGVHILSQCGMFWNWWKNLWFNRDAKFLQELEKIDFEYLSERRKNNFKVLYKSTHDIKNIDQYPNTIVMREAYSLLMREISKRVPNVGN